MITRFLILSVLITPLIYWPNLFFYYNNSKLYFFLTVTQLAVVSFIWLAYKDARWRPRVNLLSGLVLAYIGVLLLASFFGTNPLFSFWGTIDRSGSGLAWLHIAVAFVVLTSVFREPKDWRRVFIVSTTVALIVAAIFFLSLLFPDGPMIFSRSKGGSTLGNSSFLGTYLLLQIGIAGYLALTQAKTHKWLASAATAILVIALLFTTATAAKLALLGGGTLFLILLLVSSRASAWQRKVGALLLTTLTALFIAASFMLVSPDSAVHRWFVKESSETRFVLWDIAWQGILERPWLGWGLENYPDVFQMYFNPCLGSPACGGEVWFDRAHNNVLDVLVESGVVGLGLYVSIFAAAVLKLWRVVKQSIISSAVFAIIVSSLAAYFVQGLTVFDTLSSTLSWLVILGFISTIGASTIKGMHRGASSAEGARFARAFPREPSCGGMYPCLLRLARKCESFAFPFLSLRLAIKNVENRKRSWLVTALAMTILLPFAFNAFVATPARGNKATWDVKSATLLSQRIAAYEKAVTVSEQGIDLRRSMLAAQTATFILDLSDEQIAKSSTLLQKELLLAQQGLLHTIDAHPLFIRAYLDLGFVYQAWAARLDESKLSQAEAVLLDAVARFPNNPLSSWALVGVYLDQGKNSQATELAKRALAIDQGVKNSQLRYLLTLKLVGENELAFAKRDEFSLENPSISLTITPYLEKDVSSKSQEMEFLFRFYYDAAF